ncbi:Uncharacterised protein [Mycobacteroides abscessus subsp. abscessus]|nr:Uncharacterised protein [Mycobacteroides abscessus subsp. abscessus]
MCLTHYVCVLLAHIFNFHIHQAAIFLAIAQHISGLLRMNMYLHQFFIGNHQKRITETA